MTSRKRKRSTRFRGATTHGWGSMKKHRGAGNRGGRGNAGTGAKGDAKKPSVWGIRKGGKDPAKRGFKSLVPQPRTINVGHLDSISEILVQEGKALEQKGKIVINLRELGYDKLLGAGKVTKKLQVGVPVASPSAIEKISKAGGSVDVQSKAANDAADDAPDTPADASEEEITAE